MKDYILFVCGHNSGRSQMAEVLFNKYNNNPNIEAKSAGTWIKWDGLINPKVVRVLLDNGIDIHNQDKVYVPKVVNKEMIEWAKEIYTMWCMDSNIVWKRVADGDFALDDPAKDETNVESVFKECDTQVQKLIKKITGE